MSALATRVVLSSGQAQCLALIARGLTDPAIAGELGISETTGRYHVDQARRELAHRRGRMRLR